jgi:hypothetical protein
VHGNALERMSSLFSVQVSHAPKMNLPFFTKAKLNLFTLLLGTFSATSSDRMGGASATTGLCPIHYRLTVRHANQAGLARMGGAKSAQAHRRQTPRRPRVSICQKTRQFGKKSGFGVQ